MSTLRCVVSGRHRGTLFGHQRESPRIRAYLRASIAAAESIRIHLLMLIHHRHPRGTYHAGIGFGSWNALTGAILRATARFHYQIASEARITTIAALAMVIKGVHLKAPLFVGLVPPSWMTHYSRTQGAPQSLEVYSAINTTIRNIHRK